MEAEKSMLFMFFPVGVGRKAQKAPLVTYFFLAVNALVFIAPMVSEQSPRQLIANLGFVGENPFAEPTRLVTSQFVHAGFFHFFFNMLYLFLVGAVVEERIGRLRMAGLYLLGGAFAALGHHLMISPEGRLIPLVGASGSIAAIIGACVVLMPWLDFKLLYFYFLLIPFRAGGGQFWCPGLIFFGLYFFFSNLIWGLVARSSGGVSGVAYWAHIAGFLFGAVAIGLFYGFKPLFMSEEERHAAERNPAGVAIKSGPKNRGGQIPATLEPRAKVMIGPRASAAESPFLRDPANASRYSLKPEGSGYKEWIAPEAETEAKDANGKAGNPPPPSPQRAPRPPVFGRTDSKPDSPRRFKDL
jgi:membrane associated rhomboid family serine protease